MLITLTTDFGVTDAYVGVMKGVIHSIAPSAQVVDLTHGIPPQDVLGAALALEEACGYFAPNTIHVAVVDPGVGSARAGLIVQTERSYYVGPDNGIFELVLKKEKLVRAVRLDNPRHRLEHVSATFHGRDVFAPAAAHLANGTPWDAFGPITENLARLESAHSIEPVESGERLRIHVLRSDHFGNLITDLTPAVYERWNPAGFPVEFKFPHAEFTGILNTFADASSGMPLAYFGSAGRLEIAIRDGNAAAFFNASRGFSIWVSKMAE